MATTREVLEAFVQDREAIARLYARGYINEVTRTRAYKILNRAITKFEAQNK